MPRADYTAGDIGTPLHARKPDVIICDDLVEDSLLDVKKYIERQLVWYSYDCAAFLLKEPTLNENAVSVSGATVHDVALKLKQSAERLPYLTIEPISQGGSDYDCRIVHGGLATRRFRVSWNGRTESFVREVSDKELFSVIKPIIQASVNAVRAVEKEIAVGKQKELEQMRELIQRKIKGFEESAKAALKQVDQLHRQLDELS